MSEETLPIGPAVERRYAKPWEILFPHYEPRKGLHMLVRAAQEIANAEGFSDAAWMELEAELREAIRDGKKLPIRSRHTGDVKKPDPNDFLLLVTIEDVNKWLESRGSTYRWKLQSDDTHALDGLQAAKAQSPAEPAPVATASACDTPAMNPPPVATGNIAFAFDGLRWDERAWKDTLGTPPKWLEACIVLRGQRGVRVHHWNPVLIGAALVRNGHAQARSVRARFQTKPQLQDWKAVWKTYEADNFDTQ